MSEEMLWTLPSVRRQRSRRTRRTLLATILGGTVVLVGYVHNVVAIEDRIHRIEQLRRACDSLEAVVVYRRQQLASLEAPENVLPVAQRLGLQLSPTPPRYVLSEQNAP
ncbi:MAG: hypothetical protein RMK93_08035 [Bacteroidota bacterium]|nr:hypothetical protein [Bacteroidota bacterium]